MTRRGQVTGSGGRRSEVLRVLKDAAGPLSIAEIADRIGRHPNTVRFHLNTLVDSGRVKHAPPARARPGRPPPLCRAVRGVDPTGPRRHGPFLGLTKARERVLRSIHTRLMRGDMNAWNLAVGRLDAFAEPDPLVAHLSPAGAP